MNLIKRFMNYCLIITGLAVFLSFERPFVHASTPVSVPSVSVPPISASSVLALLSVSQTPSIFPLNNQMVDRVRPIASIPIELVRGDMVAQVLINDQSYRFVLDTGASNSVLLRHGKTAAFDDFAHVGDIDLLMPLTGKTVTAKRLAPLAAMIGGHTRKANFNITNAALIPWDETGLFSREANIFYDGILGSDLFEAYIVEFDQPSSIIRLYDKARSLESLSGITIPLKDMGGVWAMNIQIELASKVWEQRILLDTGFPGSLALYGLGDRDIDALTNRYGPHQGAGRQINFMLGGCRFEGGRTVAFREKLDGLNAIDGIMGMDFLRHFRFAIDHSRQQLHLINIAKDECRKGIKLQ